jgi:hypothetical protein
MRLRRRLDFNAADPPDPFHPQNFLPAVDRALPDCIHVAGPLPNIPLPSGFFQHGKKGLCPQTTQNDAETEMEILFLFCVNLRILRASRDSVAAGRAGVFVATKIVNKKYCQEKTAQAANITR